MILYYRMHARVRLRRCFLPPPSFLRDASYYYHHLLDLLFPPLLSPSSLLPLVTLCSL